MRLIAIPKEKLLGREQKLTAARRTVRRLLSLIGKSFRSLHALHSSRALRLSISSSSVAEQQAARDYLSLLGMCLRLPEASVKSILKKHKRFLLGIDNRRYKPQRSGPIREYCSQFRCERESEYRDLVARDRRSRILVSFHSGDYVYGFNYLVSLESESRHKRVLSHKPAPQCYFDNLTKAFGTRSINRSSELLLENTSVIDLSRFIRCEQTSLLMFCDLPAEYGETVTVPFLGRLARFSRGPVTLALVSRTPLLPG